MRVLIEEYRGVEIFFEKDCEMFSFSFDEGEYGQKQTYNACKTNIDKYIKENQNFEPIPIRLDSKPNQISKIVGVRKDGRFVVESPSGARSQYTGSWGGTERIVDPSDEAIYCAIEDENDSFEEKVEEHKKRLSELSNLLTGELFDENKQKSILSKYGY